MTSNLLPHLPQVATPYMEPGRCKGSNLLPLGSKKVAGWVAGCRSTFWLTYAVCSVKGSKGSNFIKNLRIRRKAKRAYRANNGNNLLHLLPQHAKRSMNREGISGVGYE